MFRKSCFLILLGLVPQLSRAQFPVSEKDAASVDEAFNKGITGDGLKCQITPVRPFLDFALRFEAGYVVECPIDQFAGHETALYTFIRIQPQNARPAVLADSGEVPALPEQLEGKVNVRRLHNVLEFSGVFATGEGDYPVDLLVTDDHNRTVQKHWTVHARLHPKEQKIAVGLPPNTARSVALSPWTGREGPNRTGPRLSVLLDAAPINPYDSKLRAWDRAFLLGALASLLREVNCASVKLVAFNLDQNREIFRQDTFDRTGFRKLAHSLQQLELGTVSYRVIQNRASVAELPLKLIRDEELDQSSKSDAIIFLGPNTRLRDRVAKESIQAQDDRRSRLFYFEYFPMLGSEFPDTIHSLTASLSGTVLKLHSPGDLASGISKMQKKLQENGIPATCPAVTAAAPE